MSEIKFPNGKHLTFSEVEFMFMRIIRMKQTLNNALGMLQEEMVYPGSLPTLSFQEQSTKVLELLFLRMDGMGVLQTLEEYKAMETIAQIYLAETCFSPETLERFYIEANKDTETIQSRLSK